MIQIISTAKRANYLAIVLVSFSIALLLVGCSKNQDEPISANNGIIATNGNWRISYYWDKKDETSNFSGYTFNFNSSGVVTASNGNNIVNGSWSESNNKMTLNFGADPQLSKISDEYVIVEKTATSIKLKDDNPTKDEKLDFIKI